MNNNKNLKKTLIIRMLTEIVEYGQKMEEEMKVRQSEIKEMYREQKVMGMQPALKSTIWSRRKK